MAITGRNLWRNTRPDSAFWMPYPEKGSYLLLDAADHTRPRTFAPLRTSKPVPGFTVVGSKAALWGAPKGGEMEMIGKIEVAEGLPHPMSQGQWTKLSTEVRAPSIWTGFDEKSAGAAIDLCGKLRGSNICSSSRMFGNWGHFELAPKLYPDGWDAVRKISGEYRRRGIRLTMYTLTNSSGGAASAGTARPSSFPPASAAT